MPFNLPISTTTSGGSSWTRPSDWIDISTVNDNEILILVGDFGAGIGFTTTIASSGTYSIDWGDGTVETLRASGTTYQHQYTIGGGTACSLGYTTYKIRIYGATGNITKWQIRRHTYTNRTQYQSYLGINFGTSYIIDYSYCFFDSSGQNAYCYDLREVAIKSFQSCTTTAYMFYQCYALASITLPTSWGSVSSCNYMFYQCYALASITLPTSWGSVSNCSYMFQNCSALASITLPTSWGSVSNCGGILQNCYALTSITLPTSWGSVSSCNNMFYYCYALTSITLPTSWGSVSNCSYMFQYCSALTSITLPTSWRSISNCSYMFQNCSALASITLPTSWGSVSNCSYMFQNCYALTNITLPTNWGSVSSCNNMFYQCYALTSITLPTSWGSISNCSNMFQICYSLKTIIGLEYLGSTTTSCNFSGFLTYCEFMQSPITIASLISAISFAGSSGYVNKVSSIRLTNASSTFTGSSPQIDVSYTSLDATALNTLFGDLPTVSGKTIKITGATGAATCTTSIATAKGWTVTN